MAGAIDLHDIAAPEILDPVIDSGQGRRRRVCAASFVPLAIARRRGALKSARNGIGMANLLRSPLLNQIRVVPGIPQRVTLSETWY